MQYESKIVSVVLFLLKLALLFICTYELEVIIAAGNSVHLSDVHAPFARSALGSIFITSLPPAQDQPRDEIPKPAMDVDVFLKMNAANKTTPTLRLQKGSF